MHFNLLRSMMDGDAREVLKSLACQLLLEKNLIADKDNLNSVFANGEGRPFHFGGRGMVATHGIQRDLHTVRQDSSTAITS